MKYEFYVLQRKAIPYIPEDQLIEDRSIIQPDGSRACYQWECRDGFSILDPNNNYQDKFDELEDTVTILFTKSNIKKKL